MIRIAIVDPQPAVRAGLAMLLRTEPGLVPVGAATDIHDGLALAQRLRPDVILLDIGLPKLNGYEAARKIREQPWGKNIVMIALTGWGQDEDRQKSKEAGFNGHLVKPVELTALMKLLAELHCQVTP